MEKALKKRNITILNKNNNFIGEAAEHGYMSFSCIAHA